MRNAETSVASVIVLLALAVLAIWGLAVLLANPIAQALIIIGVLFGLLSMSKGSGRGRRL